MACGRPGTRADEKELRRLRERAIASELQLEAVHEGIKVQYACVPYVGRVRTRVSHTLCMAPAAPPGTRRCSLRARATRPACCRRHCCRRIPVRDSNAHSCRRQECAFLSRQERKTTAGTHIPAGAVQHLRLPGGAAGASAWCWVCRLTASKHFAG